jgi:hypothetical protein
MFRKNPSHVYVLAISVLLAFFPLVILAGTTTTLAQKDSDEIKQEAYNKQFLKTSSSDSKKDMVNPYAEIDQRYYKFKKEDTMWVMKFQFISTVVIFIMVIGIVITGLFLSYRQFEFTKEMLRKQHDAALIPVKLRTDTTLTQTASAVEVQQTDTSVEPSNNTFEISKEGIKINSAVIGLIILAMSIAFFFLYLQFVYPVNIIKDYINK